MKWNKVENNCKALYEYQLINGSKPTERKILIKVIADEFPELPRMRIAYAVDRCINSVAAPMSPTTFLTFVQSYLK
ncbi:hypothetical protein [Flavobacterium sp.]|uniref:hypothetical protein n=1 Tax=Flavobacterium sp. TaxID=239 RepID=UPI0025DE9CDB|nr:hypothetical protein [Flavobacterium sp.]